MFFVLTGHSEILKAFPLSPEITICVCTLLITPKFSPGMLFVTVHLPAAHTFIPFRMMFNKSLYIFQRVAKEKPDLVRKIFLFAQAFSKLYYTLSCTFHRISVFLQKSRRPAYRQIIFQLLRTVNVEKHFILRCPKRDHPHSLWHKLAV